MKPGENQFSFDLGIQHRRRKCGFAQPDAFDTSRSSGRSIAKESNWNQMMGDVQKRPAIRPTI